MDFKVKHPQDRTGGEIFAAHCVSYIHHLERELGHRHISIGAAVLPAYAGMIPPSRWSARTPWCAPRVCGDDPGGAVGVRRHGACSPRMRG